MPAVQVIVCADIGIPDRSYVYLPRTARDLRRLPALFVHVGLYHLRCQARRQLAVLATFEEHRHNDVRIAPGRESHEPAMLIESFVVLVQRPNSQRYDL